MISMSVWLPIGVINVTNHVNGVEIASPKHQLTIVMRTIGNAASFGYPLHCQRAPWGLHHRVSAIFDGRNPTFWVLAYTIFIIMKYLLRVGNDNQA